MEEKETGQANIENADRRMKGITMKKMKRNLISVCVYILAFFIGSSIGTEIAHAETKDTYICEEYQEYIIEIAEDYNICPELIMAIVEHESSGRADAVNGSCIGLMQVSERWHHDRMERLGVTDLYDPYSNILVGTDYLLELFEKYEDIGMVLMVYNGSSDAESRWESCNYTKYATSIMDRSSELERIHGK